VKKKFGNFKVQLTTETKPKSIIDIWCESTLRRTCFLDFNPAEGIGYNNESKCLNTFMGFHGARLCESLKLEVRFLLLL